MSDHKNEKVNIYVHEEELQDNGYTYVCGVDEVGRGPLAGPCVVAAVIMPLTCRIEGINDSKKLTAKKRDKIYDEILNKAISISVSFISEEEIDEMNIYQAAKKGMLESISKLSVTPEYVLVDAMVLSELSIPHESIIHGDAKSASIAAASIVAKVTRDRYMEQMAKEYPGYGFEKHKGYCTKAHVEALEKLGPCKIHRKTFAPVSSYFNKQMSLDFND